MTSEPNQAGLRLAELTPGMELEGRVTRVELYGAFIDVGAEREGLVHISMLKPGKVNRVEDVVNTGDSVRVWVQRVDPEDGRLELTLIKPLSLRWEDIQPGMKSKGQIVRLERFGAFVDIGAERPGLVHVSEMSTEYVSKPEDVVRVGEEIDVLVLDVDRKKRQIRLSMKVAPEEEIEEETEEEEHVPTAMEVALRKALNETEATDEASGQAAAGKSQKAGKVRGEQEDILERTLKQRLRSSTESED